MALIIYHHHTIVSFPVYDEESGKWKCAASISWPKSRGVNRGIHFVRSSPELFLRFEDAEESGMEAAKNWVESRRRKGVAA